MCVAGRLGRMSKIKAQQHDLSKVVEESSVKVPELKWENTIEAVRKTRLVAPKTVSLVGFAATSRHLAPFDSRTSEIWSCNESYNANFMKNSKGEFRADRWFQMHQQEDWSRSGNPNDSRHAEWLALKHNFPIVAQEKWGDVMPNAEAFPLDEIDELIFSNVTVIDGDGKKFKWLDRYKHGYYTSSFAWMISYAIWQDKWDALDIYGFNMGTQSEYMYQKPGGEFWVGQAMAKGINVGIAENSPILRGAMYGYEVSNVLLPEQLRTRLLELSEEMPELKDLAQQHHGARLMMKALIDKPEYMELIPELLKHYQERHQEELGATSKVNFYMGAEQVTSLYLAQLQQRHDDPKGGWVDRLTMEVQKSQYRKEVVDVRGNLDAVSGAKLELNRNLAFYVTDPEAIASWERRLVELQNKEIFLTGKLAFLLGELSQIEQFIFTSENRSANMTDENDYGYIVVPDLYDTATDVLTLGDKTDGETREEESEVPETNEGGAGSSFGLARKSA